jgi:hypothetical protein
MSQQTELLQSPTKVSNVEADAALADDVQLDANNENYSKILNLSYFGEFLRDPSKRKELANKYKDLKTQQKLENAPDFDVILEFYNSVFGYKGDRKFQAFKSAISKASSDLCNYTNGSDQIAVKNVTFKQILDAIEKVISLDILSNEDSHASTRQIKNFLFKEAMTKPKTTSEEFKPHQQSPANAQNAQNATAVTSSGEHPHGEHLHHQMTVKSPEFRPHTDNGALSFIKLDEDGFIEVQPRYLLAKKGGHEQGAQAKHPQHKGAAKKNKGLAQQQGQYQQTQAYNNKTFKPAKEKKSPVQEKRAQTAATPQKQLMTPQSSKKQLSQKSPMTQHISPRGQTLRSPKVLQTVAQKEYVAKPLTQLQPAHPPTQQKETKTPKSTKRKWSHTSPIVNKEYVRKEAPLETPAPVQSSEA